MLFRVWLFPFRIAFVLKPTLFEIWISCWVVSRRRERKERKRRSQVPSREPLTFYILFNNKIKFKGSISLVNYSLFNLLIIIKIEWKTKILRRERETSEEKIINKIEKTDGRTN